ncbi:MAG: metalloprotease TldD [Betaproteobacteria bacterium TMED22]|nr:MAG: metalloprotease TldD [Betaproteobacteria bacterium TMED22]
MNVSDRNMEHASEVILSPGGLSLDALPNLFSRIATRKLDYADLYFQYSRSESWSIEDGIVKVGSFNIDQGVGARAIVDEKTAFAYTDEISIPAIHSALDATKAIADQGTTQAMPTRVSVSPPLYSSEDPLLGFSNKEKIRLLEKIEGYARQIDTRVTQVVANLAAVHDTILVTRLDGHIVSDVRPLIRLSIQVIIEHKGRREQGSFGGGGRFSYDYFNDERLKDYAQKAVDQALINMDAGPAPAGEMTVVLGSGWPGILLHEAIGHGLEGDFNRKGSSAFSGRIGERVAAKGVTVVDDGTIPDRRGSLSVDDEGTPTAKTVLIEDGILCGYMQDTLNARLMGVPPTGNGRRESYAHVPMPRMTNTYMLNGTMERDEILSSVPNGIYATNFGGGQVDIVSGKFVFSASEAYLIKDGKITRPVKGATLIGNGPDVLTRVSMIGNDMSLDSGVGTCGKDGQSVPVGVGQPTLRIDGLTVGGTDLS